MGLMRGEGILLREKYQKKYGLTQSEAIEKVGKFIKVLNELRDKMRLEKKLAAEIDLKLQAKFEDEFQKLCCD